MDKQHQDSPVDPLTDPNFIMALGLMNNIKVTHPFSLNNFLVEPNGPPKCFDKQNGNYRRGSA